MRELRPEHLAPRVGMRIDVNHSHWPLAAIPLKIGYVMK
jgi:hypothetical protein